jgi:predicted Zn-dependent peptidase
MSGEPVVTELENGLRLAHQYIADSGVVHFGIFINAGTRDETGREKGMAHFIEHVLFKGTQKRKAFHILSRLETVGGDLNAYTTKEETCIHASVAASFFDRAAELISDIVSNSVFPENELEKEKEVVIDEIRSCQDNPQEQIYDDFEEMLFKGHPLSNPILGTEATVRSFTRKDITDFISRNYDNREIVLACVGNVTQEEAVAVCRRHFESFGFKSGRKKRKDPLRYKPFDYRTKKSNYQAHCIIGNTAYSYHHKRRTGLILLNNILGGPGMNSRLNLSLRERHGIAYNLYSTYTPYSDTSCFSIYLGTDDQNISKSIELCLKELRKMREKKLGSVQLKQAKQQLMGNIMLSQENRAGLMQIYGKSLLSYGYIESLKEVYSRIGAIKAEELQEIAEEIFDEKKLSILVYNS